jgi:hypothetical protein
VESREKKLDSQRERKRVHFPISKYFGPFIVNFESLLRANPKRRERKRESERDGGIESTCTIYTP